MWLYWQRQSRAIPALTKIFVAAYDTFLLAFLRMHNTISHTWRALLVSFSFVRVRLPRMHSPKNSIFSTTNLNINFFCGNTRIRQSKTDIRCEPWTQCRHSYPLSIRGLKVPAALALKSCIAYNTEVKKFILTHI